jgi:uncharacterized phiE125 gp8 family phage protein
MSMILLEGPAEEPLALAAAKQWLRVEHDDDDDLVAALITAARLQAEAETRRLLVSQRWRLVMDFWPAGGSVAVPLGPLLSVEAARVHAADGSEIALDIEPIVVNAAAQPPRLTLPTRPVPRGEAGVEIDLVLGYGDAADVPEPFRQAIRLILADWYDNRALLPPPGNAQQLPAAACAMLAPYKILRL